MTQTLAHQCDIEGRVYGLASASEFLPTPCTVTLDLDADGSSGAPDPDYRAPVLCGAGAVWVSDTSDALLTSGYRPDSLRVRLLPSLPDGGSEYLSAAPPASVGISGQGGSWLILRPASGTATAAAASAGLQAALRSVRYHNDASLPTPGPRTAEVVLFAKNGQSDTAYAYITVVARPYAGRDTALSACEGSPAFALSPLLGAGAAAGGIWQPNAPFFDPQTAGSQSFAYIVSSAECPADTAVISVEVAPLPTFSLGGDTSACAGQPLVLNTGGAAATWSAGGNPSSSLSVSAPGVYWAEVVSAAGCRFRDSVTVTFLPAVQNNATVSRCAGSTFVWNGFSLSADTVACVTLTASSGCDSVDCLALVFFYPSMSLDTVVCGSGPFVWQGQTYPQSGEYRDTLQVGGCLTALLLRLDLARPDTFPVAASICAGGSYAIGNQSFVQEGVYYVPLPSAEGCDSTVSLTLSVLQAPSARIGGDTLFCPEGGSVPLTAFPPGMVYVWSDGSAGATLNADREGVYAVTVTNAEGCADSAAFFLRAKCEGAGVYVPNVFSPDGDQQNDFLGVFADAQQVRGVELFRVYDRWGNLVFESNTLEINSETAGWDGTWQGKRLPPGVFAWYAELRLSDGGLLRKWGDVTLLR
jgi:gliding motility-associated-like protein